MSGYVCWDPEIEDDPGQAPHERQIVEGYVSALGAAEEYAGRLHKQSTEPADEVTVMVRDSEGVLWRFAVSAEWTRALYGSEVES